MSSIEKVWIQTKHFFSSTANDFYSISCVSWSQLLKANPTDFMWFLWKVKHKQRAVCFFFTEWRVPTNYTGFFGYPVFELLTWRCRFKRKQKILLSCNHKKKQFPTGFRKSSEVQSAFCTTVSRILPSTLLAIWSRRRDHCWKRRIRTVKYGIGAFCAIPNHGSANAKVFWENEQARFCS